mmetsp:Transcript_68660/g.108915  ORF Transcript_68660/g.108915 Transcript_68660/m.108915 type:complete len:115 (-) Transcript_68660:20-364(-)
MTRAERAGGARPSRNFAWSTRKVMTLTYALSMNGMANFTFRISVRIMFESVDRMRRSFSFFSFDPEAVNTTDFMKDTTKSVGRRNMDDTDPFMTSHARPRGDTGGGVSSWLDKD